MDRKRSSFFARLLAENGKCLGGRGRTDRGAELAEIRIALARAGGRPQPSPTFARRPEGRYDRFIPENQHFLFMGR